MNKMLANIALRQPNNNLHTCPVTNISYYSNCSVISCPANIAQQQDNIGGCFLQTTKHPNEVDISRFLHLTIKEVKQRYHRGIKRVNNFIEFYQWLQNYRDMTAKKSYCNKCGINGKNCLNTTRCQRRQKIFQRASKRYLLRIKLLSIKPHEFWAIVMAQQQGKINVLSRRSMRQATKSLTRITNGVNHANSRQNSPGTH